MRCEVSAREDRNRSSQSSQEIVLSLWNNADNISSINQQERDSYETSLHRFVVGLNST